MKGCPLCCAWCHNPESHSVDEELSFRVERCAACGACLRVCPNGAIFSEPVYHVDREKCNKCFKCVMHCPSLAFEKVGRYYAPAKLVSKLMQDKAYYDTSGGGVTFSGGEPLMHIGYLSEVAQLLKNEKVSVAIETSGYFEYDLFKEKLLSLVDLVYFDLKIMDTSDHLKYTGVDNGLILKNFKKLVQEDCVEVVPRMPLVPGVTDTVDNIAAVEKFLQETGGLKLVKLSFNLFGEEKKKRIRS